MSDLLGNPEDRFSYVAAHSPIKALLFGVYLTCGLIDIHPKCHFVPFSIGLFAHCFVLHVAFYRMFLFVSQHISTIGDYEKVSDIYLNAKVLQHLYNANFFLSTQKFLLAILRLTSPFFAFNMKTKTMQLMVAEKTSR